MDNIIVKITAESDMSEATKDFDSLKQKEAEILQGMEALKKKQAEFQGAPKVISLLDAEYKKLEKDLKTTQTSMSGFANSQKKVNDTVADGAVKSLTMAKQLKVLKIQMQEMEDAGANMSDAAFVQVAIKAGQLEDQIGDTRQQVAHLASDTRGLDTAMGVGRGLAGGFSAATAAAALLGGESEMLSKAFFQVQNVMAVVNGITEVENMLNSAGVVVTNLKAVATSNETLAKIKNYTATKIAAANTVLETAANNGSKVAKVGATVTQWALNAAVMAFPIVLLVAGLAAIAAGFMMYSNNALAAQIAQAKLNSEVDNFNADMSEREKITQHTVDLMKAQGKTSEEVRAYEKKRAEDNLKYANQQNAYLLKNKLATEDQLKASSEAVIKAQSDLSDLNRKQRVDEITEQNAAIKTKEDAQKAANEKAQETSKEHAKYLLEIDKQLEDSTLSIMKDGFAKQEAQIILEFNRKIALIKGNSDKEIALRASLEVEKNKKIAAIAGAETLKGEKLTGDGVIKMFEKTQDKKSDILTKAEDTITNRVKNSIKKNDEVNKEEADGYRLKEEEKVAITAASMQAVGEIGNLLFEGAAQKRDQELSDLDREYSAKIEAAEGNKKLQMKLEDELAAKKLEIRIKQAKADKAQAVFNIGLATAQAIIGMLSNPGGTAGIVLSVLAGVTGAAQMAAALAKPLPKYANGKKAGGGGHFATVGELGAETMWIPDNAAVIPHNRAMNFDTFKDFNIPFEMDSKLMRGSEIDYDKLGKSVGKNIKIPTPKPVTVHVDKSGVAVDYSGNKTTYLNKKYQGSWN